MSILEYTVNFIAIAAFAWLFYWLFLIVGSLPRRLRFLRNLREALIRLQAEYAKRAEKVRQGKATHAMLDDAFNDLEFRGPDALNPIQLVQNMARSWRLGDSQLAASEFGIWKEQIAMGWQRHASLAVLATDTGMLGTVAGGLFAFQHIGSSQEPFAAFSALALAMLTTAAGLIIAIVVRIVLNGVFDKRLQEVELVARQVVLDVVRIDLQIRQTTRNSPTTRKTANRVTANIPARRIDQMAFDVQQVSPMTAVPKNDSRNGHVKFEEDKS